MSRSQQGLSTKESWDLRASCDAVVLATPTARKRAADARLPRSASPAVGPAVRQTSSVLGSTAYPRANQRVTVHQASALNSCNLHTYLHRPPTSPNANSQLRPPATAAVLLENHQRRLSSDPLALPSDVRTYEQPPKQSLGFVQTTAKADIKADVNLTTAALYRHQLGQVLQPEQPCLPMAKSTTGYLLPQCPTPVQPELLSLSASTALTALPVNATKHESMQQSVDLGYESDDNQASDCSSSSSDSAQDACLPTSTLSQDMDDCFSLDTSQALTDASSSIGDADLTGSLLANPEKAFPLMTPSVMGMTPTVAFVGIGPEAGTESRTRGLSVRVKYAGIANNAVRAAFQKAGFKRTSRADWNVLWSKALKPEAYSALTKFQRANHFPGTWQLGRKDKLCTNLARAKRTRGSFFDAIPKFYILPRDRQELKQYAAAHPDQLYIQKPVASSRGRGIKLVPDPSSIPPEKACLVQHYISNPHTINGLKYDLRVYVVVTCLNPLRVYLYEEGLVRFASERFSLHKSKLRRRCVHVTNYSINKHQPGFIANKDADCDGVGSKWSLRALQEHLEGQCGIQWQGIWSQVHDLVMAAVLAAEPELHSAARMHVPHRTNCFEIFGFDILLDDKLRAWLIEVNTGPNLSSSSPLDKQLKHKMVAQMLHLVGVVPYDRGEYKAQQKLEQTARLTGLPVPRSTCHAGSGRTLSSSGRTLVSCGSTLSSCGSLVGSSRLETVAPSQSQLGMRRSADWLPATAASAAAASASGVPDNVVELVRETIAEAARSHQWQRVFPCSNDPERYLDKFEMQRTDTKHVCQALKGWDSQRPQDVVIKTLSQSTSRAWR
ncbi:hypothetical protein WJX77_003291 [Trebouxia sp. C0004]